MKYLRIVVMCLICALFCSVFLSCTPTQNSNAPSTAKDVLDGERSISHSNDLSEIAYIWRMSKSFARTSIVVPPSMSIGPEVQNPALIYYENPNHVNWQYEYPVMDSDSYWFFQYSYMLWSDCRVGVYRTSFSESENHGETGEDVYYVHLIFEKKAPISTEECLPEAWWYFTGKYIYTSETSATADTSLLKPGASVRSLLDSFPELGLYCKVDGRFPFTVSGDVYAGPAVLMVNEGFFLITTELSADGTDVLIKEVTKQDTLTYPDLCALFGA